VDEKSRCAAQALSSLTCAFIYGVVYSYELWSMSLVQVVEKAIEQLPRPERLKVCRDLPDLIGRKPENLIGSGPLRSLINWR